MYQLGIFKAKHIAPGTKIIKQWKHFQSVLSIASFFPKAGGFLFIVVLSPVH